MSRDPCSVTPVEKRAVVTTLLGTDTLVGGWLTIAGPFPRIFVSVAYKGFRLAVSGLESTLAGCPISVAFKRLRRNLLLNGLDEAYQGPFGSLESSEPARGAQNYL